MTYIIETPPAVPDHITVRNRANAQHSTGPRTEGGKRVSRGNSLKHGLCANPAAGVVEDRQWFDDLQAGLVERFVPRDPMEAGLVHRIAVCLWRLQRAAGIDAAVGNIAGHAVPSSNDRARAWIARISGNFHAITWVEETDPAIIAKRKREGYRPRGGKWYRIERQYLRYADKERDEVMMNDGAAIAAMILMIEDLTRRLTSHAFDNMDAQLLAWLMGESLERLIPPEYEEDQSANYDPSSKRWSMAIDDLIGQARRRPAGHPLPDVLKDAIATRLATLHAQRQVVQDPDTAQQDKDRRTAALLPDGKTLDRLIRYEGHAERGLSRSLDMLAKLRGVTVESIAATITAPGPAGGTFELHGQRTRWETNR